MSIDFSSALGIHPQALAIRARRAELLASNLANADTPGYKARDIDFQAALKASIQSASGRSTSNFAQAPADNLRRTDKNHLSIPVVDRVSIGQPAVQTLYRVPNHASLDGNTVDAQLEKTAFADNALHYQATLTFLDSKFKGLLTAIKG